MTRKEQVEKARELLASGALSEDACKALKADFSELSESEDERIRKALTKMISDIYGGYPFEKYGIFKKDALAYLEKQKERKSVEWSEEDEKMRKSIINILGTNTDAHEEGWAIFADEIAWLKARRPQYHWKPSEE